MQCPYCGSTETKVVNSRPTSHGTIRRRRQCLLCGKRFTTIERVVAPLRVIKRDKRREPFDRQKLLRGIQLACVKRPISAETVEKMADAIEEELLDMGRAEVPSQLIGNLVLERLKKLDHVAYIRFASVYLNLSDLEDIQEEINRLMSSPE